MVAANLSSATYRMVQLFGQLADLLAAEDAAGMLGNDNGAPAADVVATAGRDLAEATGAARILAARLDALQNVISGLNGPRAEPRGAYVMSLSAEFDSAADRRAYAVVSLGAAA
jgi:hypothetical protein